MMKLKRVCDGCRWNIQNLMEESHKLSSHPCSNEGKIHKAGGDTLSCMHYLAIKILSPIERENDSRRCDINDGEISQADLDNFSCGLCRCNSCHTQE